MSSTVVSFNVATFLPRLQRQVAPGYHLQRTTVDSLNAFLDLVLENVAQTMLQLHQHTNKMTVDVKTVQCALNLLFPESLFDFARSAGTTAVTRYLANSKVNVPASTDGQESKKTPRVSKSQRAGLVFPVSRVIPTLKRVADRVQPSAAVFLTAVLEFLATEMIESASESTSGGKRKQISVYDLSRSVWGDRGMQHGSSWMSGDAEMQKVAKRIKWGSLDRGWKGIYTDSLRPTKRSKKTVLPSSTENDVSGVTVADNTQPSIAL